MSWEKRVDNKILFGLISWSEETDWEWPNRNRFVIRFLFVPIFVRYFR